MYRAPYAEALQFRCILCTMTIKNETEIETESHFSVFPLPLPPYKAQSGCSYVFPPPNIKNVNGVVSPPQEQSS